MGVIEFVPCLAGGDGLGGGGRKARGVRSDADAAEVETVGVQADGEGGFGLGISAVVDVAGGDEEIHAKVIELEMAGLAEFEGELCAAWAVLRVAVFVFPAGVVKKGEEADDFLVGCVMVGEIQAIATDREPVGGAVERVCGETKPGGNELPEREFGGEEHGEG
jgi:hypothetical protein